MSGEKYQRKRECNNIFLAIEHLSSVSVCLLSIIYEIYKFTFPMIYLNFLGPV